MPTTERILVFGRPGAGKSYQFLKIAEFVRPAPCFVLDSDDSYGRLLETEFRDLDNVTVYPVFEYEEWVSALKEVREEVHRLAEGCDNSARPWVCVDRAEVFWEAAQEHYVERVFGEGMGDYFLKKRIELEQMLKTKGGKDHLMVLEGDKDWQVINRMYKQSWLKLISPSFPAHLYVVVAAEKIEKRDEEIVHETYGWLGARPTGQKALPFQVHTIFFFDRKRDEFRVTTVKDRGRKEFDRQKLVSLPRQYLVAKAGWGKGE